MAGKGRTLDYMEIGPYNLPKGSTVDVDIIPYGGGLYANVAA
jgi:hypothetical protein